MSFFTRGSGWLRQITKSGSVPLSAAIALCWMIRLVLEYPVQYLFVPDSTIIVAQVASWGWILGQSLLAFVGSQFVLALTRRLFSGVAGRVPLFTRWSELVERQLAHPWKPLLAILGATAAVNLAAWHSFNPPGRYPDDAAYLLQARIFAMGRWKTPAAPLPKFFEQLYVFVTPFTAAKYPPGFSLALTPGVLMGLPGLMPLIFLSVAGLLIFDLARRFTNVWVAAVGWILWVSLPYEVSAFSAFESETLTLTLIVVGWWSLSRWFDTRRFRYLAVLTTATAWGGITRPATMLAFAVPVVAVLAADAVRRRYLSKLTLAAFIGSLVILILPLWSFKTIGTWRSTPLQEYIRTYMPFESYGFHSVPHREPRVVSDDIRLHIKLMRTSADRLARGSAWNEMQARLAYVRGDLFGGWRKWLILFVVAGLLLAPIKAWVAITFVPLLFAFYLPHPQPVALTIYYVEAYSVVCFLAAAGICGTVFRLTNSTERENGFSQKWTHPWAGPVLLVVLFALGISDFRLRSSLSEAVQGPCRRLQEQLAQIKNKRALVFVRFDENNEVPPLLVENVPDRETASVLLAHDRGPENEELIRVYPERTPYIYDASTDRLLRNVNPATRNQFREPSPR